MTVHIQNSAIESQAAPRARLHLVWVAALSCILALVAAANAHAGTLQNVQARGHIVCGVGERQGGLSATDADGRWTGLEVEFCAALAAAAIGDKSAAKFRAASKADGPRILKSGDVDVLLGALSWTLSREAELGMRAAGVLFHDGQALLVNRSFGVSSVLELSGASICVSNGTGATESISTYFSRRQMRYTLVESEKWDDQVKSYIAGSCTAMSGDLSMLALERSRMHSPLDHLLLPELLSIDLLGPMVRQGDEDWFTLVRWTLMALIHAEELGLTRANVDENLGTQSAPLRRFLGETAGLGAPLGLPDTWAYRIIKQVGNYGEIFDRTLGEGSSVKMARGRNDIWTRGGLMVAPAFR